MPSSLTYEAPPHSTDLSLGEQFYTDILPADAIDHAALTYGVSPLLMLNLAKCESALNPDAIGDKGTSYGLYQIHLPAHPDISKQQALNPTWAANWTAKEIKSGHGSMWTCWDYQ